MNLSHLLSPALRGFDAEVRAFVRAELPPAIRAKVLRHEALGRDEQTVWQRRLVARGWGAPNWPVEHGGPGWDLLQRQVFAQALAEEGAPDFLAFGQNMLAPIIMSAGTDAQKRALLPRILSLDDWWCQGFSEPEAGSDLASLRTKAVADGNGWIVEGHKTWTSFAHLADRMFCLVRTDPAAPARDGLSMLLIDMKAPGVDVRPIITIDGRHTVNDVFLDRVRVPADAIIGAPGEGWRLARSLLGFERSGQARTGTSRRDLQRLKDFAGSIATDGTTLADLPSFRDRIAVVEIDLLALELTQLRWLAGAPELAPFGASLMKLSGSEITQRLTELLLEAGGTAALPYGDDAWNDDAPETLRGLAPAFLRRRVATIYGGSSEIQHDIVARSALGLREAR